MIAVAVALGVLSGLVIAICLEDRPAGPMTDDAIMVATMTGLVVLGFVGMLVGVAINPPTQWSGPAPAPSSCVTPGALDPPSPFCGVRR